jgi:uncharacterized membrane protein
MAVKAARFVNLVLAGVLTGNEFGGWVGTHPALRALPLDTHVRAEQAVTRRFGAIMPFLMTAAIASCLPVLSLTRDKRSAAYRCTLAGMLCYVSMLGVTFAGNMPINRRTLRLAADVDPAAWLALRARWDRWHAVRNALNLAGFGFLVAGALPPSDTRTVSGVPAGGGGPS